MAWAVFSAYQAITIFAVVQLQILKTGLTNPDLLNSGKVSELVQAVLPHQSEYIKKYGASGYHFLLDELESRLLKELQLILRGEESDKASLKQAAVILKESERLMGEIAKTEIS